MHTKSKAIFEDIWNVINYLADDTGDTAGSLENPTNAGMYVLTNYRKHYGASEILDKYILQEISDKLESDLIVLPSSVHDVIILAKDKRMRYRELAGMVKEINATEVLPEEFLSNHVYVYERKYGDLKIAV